MSNLININSHVETKLINYVNDELDDYDIYIEKYQRFNFYFNSKKLLKEILKIFKFKDIGNIYEFEDIVPKPEVLYMSDVSDPKLFYRINVSEKINSILIYSADKYSVKYIFLIDLQYYKKFLKKMMKLKEHDSKANLFKYTDFNCNLKEYIEISERREDNKHDEDRIKIPVSIIKKTVPSEHLVFDQDSNLNLVMNDIQTFFKKETQSLYKELEITYKRGIILYGDPGNGKSAMIREIIRVIPNVNKIIINPNTPDFLKVLQDLLEALNDKQTIIVIEDIDSLIDEYNRSEFLNILDGITINSGTYFIGTTNYPEQIDPAFMNRPGRFDRTFKIDNPSETLRRLYFENKKLTKILGKYKIFSKKKSDDKENILKLFVDNSKDLPMASLKELITSTSYLLANTEDLSIEEAVTKTYDLMSKNRSEHIEQHNTYKRKRYHHDEYTFNRF
jgi:DNA replication protein DnaC